MTTRKRLAALLLLIGLALSTVACDCLSEAYARQHPQTCDGEYAPHPTPALEPVPVN